MGNLNDAWPSPTVAFNDCSDPLEWMRRAVRQKAKWGKKTGSGAGLTVSDACIFDALGCQNLAAGETLIEMSRRITSDLDAGVPFQQLISSTPFTKESYMSRAPESNETITVPIDGHKVLELFAGMGGGVAADITLGNEIVAVSEWEPDCHKILPKRVPGANLHGDIQELDGFAYRGLVDEVSGGFPCQAISVAGKQKGAEMNQHGTGELSVEAYSALSPEDRVKACDEGHFHPDFWKFCELPVAERRALLKSTSALAWEYLRIVKEVRPKFVFGENVRNLISDKHLPFLNQFLDTLVQLGYGGAWCILSAKQVGAPHLRERFWLLAEFGIKGGFKRMETKHIDSVALKYVAPAGYEIPAELANTPVKQIQPPHWMTMAMGTHGRGGCPHKGVVGALVDGDKPQVQVLLVDQVHAQEEPEKWRTKEEGWPTPLSSDHSHGSPLQRDGGGKPFLTGAVFIAESQPEVVVGQDGRNIIVQPGADWGTPRANCTGATFTGTERAARDLATQAFIDEVGLETWATPRVGGQGTDVLVRADGKVRDDVETQARMAKLGITDDMADEAGRDAFVDPVGEGRRIISEMLLDILEQPGHTAESIAFLKRGLPVKSVVEVYRGAVGVDAKMRRLNTILLAIRVRGNGNWTTPNARDWKDDRCPPPRNDGTIRDDQLPRQVAAEEQPDLLWATDEVFQTLGINLIGVGETYEREGDSWPTPLASDIEKLPSGSLGRAVMPGYIQSHRTTDKNYKKGKTLAELDSDTSEKIWMTPNTLDSGDLRSVAAFERQQFEVLPGRTQPANLREQVHPEVQEGFAALAQGKEWPGTEGNPEAKEQKPVTHNGRLNPDWVELLMGFPVGWTDINCENPQWMVGDNGENLWPKGRGRAQFDYEAPRLIELVPRSQEAKWRNARLKALGNAQVPACKVAARRMLAEYIDLNMRDGQTEFPFMESDHAK